jgi:predicted RNA binding protein YcfA (HicA-like mRNA interferase family)
MVTNKELRRLIEMHDFEVVRHTGKGHWLIRHMKNGGKMTVPCSPHGGKRGFKNAEADMKKVARGHYLRTA